MVSNIYCGTVEWKCGDRDGELGQDWCDDDVTDGGWGLGMRLEQRER